MEYKTIWRANLRRHRGTLIGVCFLMFFTSAALGTVLSVWTNSGRYVSAEMERTGFGQLTAWVSGLDQENTLRDEITALPEVSRVDIQELIFSDYTVGEQESDSEGQLLLYHAQENRYRFF